MGSKVVRKLIKNGNGVTCTRRTDSDLSRLEDLKSDVCWIPADPGAAEQAIRKSGFGWVLNMVCDYGRGKSSCDDMTEANLGYPLKVLNSAVKYGVPNYLTIGTGLPEGFSMYSFSKKIFSEFGRFYSDRQGINFYNLRLEMFYGADEPENRFLPSVIRSMLAGKEVNTTTGSQRRDIIAAEDVVQAVGMVIGSGQKGYLEVPVGTGIAPTVSEILDHIWEETGRRSRVNKGAVPMRENEPDCVADTAFLESIGIWEPMDWRAGIRQMILEIKRGQS